VSLDPLSGTPLYQQVSAILRRQIESGELGGDRPLPSLVTIMQTYGVARGTAAKAVKVIVDEGLAVVVPGKGVFVLPG
jgi:DNA-binding GntR family transcriptional regulator